MLIRQEPVDIPIVPAAVYRKDWIDMFDWLGYENSAWSVERVKELVKGLMESEEFYHMTPAMLYSNLLSKGVLNISGNRHGQFFKKLPQAIQTEEGRKVIKDYVILIQKDIHRICQILVLMGGEKRLRQPHPKNLPNL
jgi:hypothetical protein